MTVEELKQAGAIYVEHVKDGLEQYENEIVKMTEAEAESFFMAKMQETGKTRLFLDFYYFVLEEQAKKRIEEQLSEDEVSWLKSFARQEEQRKGEVIFKAREELVRIAVKLNGSEMLFSTFYLVEENGSSIWWGNYGEQYIVMRQDSTFSIK